MLLPNVAIAGGKPADRAPASIAILELAASASAFEKKIVPLAQSLHCRCVLRLIGAPVNALTLQVLVLGVSEAECEVNAHMLVD